MSDAVNRWEAVLRTVPDTAVARYSAAFESLWSDEWRESFGTQSTHLVIVWDGQPIGDRLLLEHLTPLDWALAVSHRTLREGFGDKDRDWSLHIVDLTFGNYRETWAIRHAASLLDAMPWVRLYALLKMKRRAYERLELPGPGVVTWPRTPSLAGTCTRRGRTAVDDAVRGMVRTWQGSLQRRDDHHDLNNSVGAYVLADRLGVDPPVSEKVRLGTRAFLQRMRWTVSERPDEIEHGPAATLHVEGPARVIVVDDQVNEGWSGLTAHLLGLRPVAANPVMVDDELRLFAKNDTGAVTMSCTTGAAPLVERLTRADFGRRNFTFRYVDTERSEAVPAPELILLDLRLATTRDRRKQERERAQILRLVEIAEEHCLEGTPGLPWPGMAARELQLIRDWCAPTDHAGRGEVEAITLLARMLAMATPQTPVILFSSTGRADVKAPLRPYGNILASFEKPRALDPTQNLEAALAALQRELVEAKRLLRTGRELTAIAETVAAGEAWLPGVHAEAEPTTPARFHLECYYDESGTLETGMTVSALAVAYATEQEAERLHEAQPNTIVDIPFTDRVTLRYRLAGARNLVLPGTRGFPKYADGVAEDLITEVTSRIRRRLQLPPVSLPGEGAGIEVPLSRISLSALRCTAIEPVPKRFQDWLTAMVQKPAQGAAAPMVRVDTRYAQLRNPAESLAAIIKFVMGLLEEAWLQQVWDAREERDRHLALTVPPTELPCAVLRTMPEPWQSGCAALLAEDFGTVVASGDLATAAEGAFADGLRSLTGPEAGILAFHAEIPANERSADTFFDAAVDRRLALIAESAAYDCVELLLGCRAATYRHFFATRKFGDKDKRFGKEELREEHLRWGAVPWYRDDGSGLTEALREAAIADRDGQLDALEEFFAHGKYADGQRPINADAAVRAVQEIRQCVSKVRDHELVTKARPYKRLADSTELPYVKYVYPTEFSGRAMLESYGPSSFGPLARAIAYRRATPDGPVLRGAVGVRVSSKTVANHRYIHALADWVPRLHANSRSPILDLMAVHLLIAGGREQLETYETLIKACELVDSRRGSQAAELLCASAWRTVATGVTVDGSARVLPLGLPLVVKIGRVLPDLTGLQLQRLNCPNSLEVLPGIVLRRGRSAAGRIRPVTVVESSESVPVQQTASLGPTEVVVILVRRGIEKFESLQSRARHLGVVDATVDRTRNGNLRLRFDVNRQRPEFWQALGKLHANRGANVPNEIRDRLL
jgi:hypothetical protein